MSNKLLEIILAFFALAGSIDLIVLMETFRRDGDGSYIKGFINFMNANSRYDRY
ncbi:hypothetical protein Q757_05870 [Oenococcus alcoholitolerans]|uniref:Uncharacterized protein n=1 Tax=Oenococcus alcoholitolerans TaxID=931074 RepID=A0ABR4XR70_9LACO|nr:hypothetical protein Q757_05870 [Oenococcus alcoholitolerans]